MTNAFRTGAWLAIAVALAPEPAIAKPRPEAVRKACEKDYAEARKLEGNGQMAAAEKLLKRCAVPACGAFLEHQCTVRYSVIDSDTPSVVPIVTDAKGEPVVDVEVAIDAEPMVKQLDGRAIRIAPGLHQFTFKRAADGQVAHRSVLISQGQRNLRIEVTMSATRTPNPPAMSATRAPNPPAKTATRAPNPPAMSVTRAPNPPAMSAPLTEPPRGEPTLPTAVESATADRGAPAVPRTDPPAPQPRRFEVRHPSSIPSYLMLATGVAGIGGYGVFTYWGRADNAKLADCTPDCSAASVQHIRTLYLTANISLGVGAAALVTGVLLRWRSHSTYRVDVQSTKGGGLATISRTF